MTEPDLDVVVTSLIAADIPDESVLEVAAEWPRAELSSALLTVLATSRRPVTRDRAARLLKRFLVPEHLDAAVQILHDPDESTSVQRWTVEGLDRLAYAGLLGWDELSVVVGELVAREEPELRTGLLGLLMSLPWRAGSATVFIASLDSADPFVVAAALNGLRWHQDAVAQIDPAARHRLSGHPSPLVRAALAEVLGEGSTT